MSTDALALAFRSLQLPTMAALWEESVQPVSYTHLLAEIGRAHV